jgi:hypothetical protein
VFFQKRTQVAQEGVSCVRRSDFLNEFLSIRSGSVWMIHQDQITPRRVGVKRTGAWKSLWEKTRIFVGTRSSPAPGVR